MSSFVNLLSDGCADIEKCGDVVVSAKDNMIGMFCHFCCDIFTNINQFWHHLQLMHNDKLRFTKEHNVYSIEELICPSDQEENVELHTNSSMGSVDGVPAEAAVSADKTQKPTSNVKNHRILNKLAAHKSKSSHRSSSKSSQADFENILTEITSANHQERDVLAEVHAMLFETEDKPESQPEKKLCSTDQQQNQLQDTKSQETEQTVGSRQFKFSSRLREFTKRNSEKSQTTCDLKSYAISRTARKQEQQLRLSNIKDRIFRSLENEPINLNPYTRKEASKEIQTKSKCTYSKCKVYTAYQKQHKINLKDTNSTINKMKSPQGVTEENNEQEKIDVLNTNGTTSLGGSSVSPLVTKIECLPNFDFKVLKNVEKPLPKPTTVKMEDPHSDIMKSSHISSLSTIVNPPSKKRPSLSELTESKRLKSEESRMPTPRSSLNFDLSDSVVEFLQKDLKSSQFDADSLLKLAELKEEDSKEQSVDLSEATKVEGTEKSAMRDDLPLLKFVGLSVLKNDNYEDLKPIEAVDELRSKATKFCNMLRNCETIWNSKRFETQFGSTVLKDLAMFREKVNRVFHIDLNISELKRILNIITTWYKKMIDLKFFKKATISSVNEHYLNLFGFLPKISRCVYYCEWCRETNSSKSRYEKHKLSHNGKFSCQHCERIFQQRGYLLNHMRAQHGIDI